MKRDQGLEETIQRSGIQLIKLDKGERLYK